MTEKQIYSWIFLAIALASQNGPANTKAIADIADGINHAVPTEKEINISLRWLTSKGYIIKEDSGYIITSKGKQSYNKAADKTTLLLKIWKNLEVLL